MAKVRFSLQPVVRVEVVGEMDKRGNQLYVRKDDGLVARLLKYLSDSEIYLAARGGVSGGGIHVGYYAAEDATKIETWLLENGAKRGRTR